MSNHPTLSEKGVQEFEEILESARKKLRSIVEDVIGNAYVDAATYIESDSWLNYREQLRLEMQREYVEGESLENAWAHSIRDRIFNEHKEELIKLLNQDLLQKIDNLERQIEHMRQRY